MVPLIIEGPLKYLVGQHDFDIGAVNPSRNLGNRNLGNAVDRTSAVNVPSYHRGRR